MAGTDKTDIPLHDQVNELRQKVARMVELGSTEGFFRAYFRMLKGSMSTAEEVFNLLNEEYFDYWGEYRYTSWGSFKETKNRYLRKPKP